MATGKAEIRGHRSRLELLAVPRPATRIGLVAAFACLGYLAWNFLTIGLMAYVSGVGSSFCILCAGAIWGMRDKAESLHEVDSLSAAEFKKACAAATKLRQRATWRAAWVAACALAAASPAISQQFVSTIWEWMPIVGAVGVAEGAYGFLIANAWDEQVRRLRDDQQFRAKEQDERDAIIERIQNETRSAPVGDSGWTKVAGTLNSSLPH